MKDKTVETMATYDIKKRLKQLKPMQKKIKQYGEEAFNIETIEEILMGICLRYGYKINSIIPRYAIVCEESGDIPVDFAFYVISITKAKRPARWLGELYGKTLWEVLAVAVITICDDIRKERKNNE